MAETIAIISTNRKLKKENDKLRDGINKLKNEDTLQEGLEAVKIRK